MEIQRLIQWFKSLSFSSIAGYILWIVALLLTVILSPVCIVYAMFCTNFNKYAMNLAIRVDKYGNYLLAPIFNRWFITGEGFQFGQGDFTISYALGMNVLAGTLRAPGILLNNILNFFQPNHAVLTVKNYVPS